ncbi:putative transcription factor interactor and regulator CCHC(Zn) family [Arabidopsis thaliana]
MMDIHIPQPLMEIIVSKVAEDGVDALKNWLLAGRERKDVVMSTKTLPSVRIDMDNHFMWWSMPHSKYYSSFQKCLAANNPYAKFVEKNKGLTYESTTGYYQMRCRWNVTHDKPVFIDMNIEKRCIMHPPFQPGRMVRRTCLRCKKVGHMCKRCLA